MRLPGIIEPVLLIEDFHDCPRSGVAELGGVRHRFSCLFDRELDEYSDTYLVVPISDEEWRLECEAHEISVGRPSAPEVARVLSERPPRLPAARPRYDEIEALLEGRRELDASTAQRVVGEFMRRSLDVLFWEGHRLWSVRWRHAAS